MLPYQRSYFQTTLLAKLVYWQSSDSKSEFYPTLDVKPAFGIQMADTGHWFLSNDYVSYNDIRNGFIVRIFKNTYKKNWQCLTDLSAFSKAGQFLRVDAPLHSENLTVAKDDVWEYAEIQSPGNEYGVNFMDLLHEDYPAEALENYFLNFLSKPLQAKQQPIEKLDNVQDFFNAYLEQLSHLIIAFKQVQQSNGCGFPRNKTGSFLSCFYKDTAGYFWSDIDRLEWTCSEHEFYTIILDEISLVTDFMIHIGCLDEQRKNNIQNTARHVCKLV